uniref:Uncharacterized protein n=1 Tax=Trypanosoma congolense (strain IL3000) TaxID=1068625 RepID=G0UU50_TRYCI|nr:conserved hypothetical protein [Trypanosoma congolense IL3000]
MNTGKVGFERRAVRGSNVGLVCGTSVNQQRSGIPPSEDPSKSSANLLCKLKSVFDEVISSLENVGDSHSVDDFLSTMEEELRVFKAAKVRKCAELQRQCEEVKQSRSHAPEPPVEEQVEQSDREISGWLRAVKQSMIKQKKASPRPVEVGEVRREEILALRHASALLSEERQRKAEEKRLEKRQEMKLKLGAAGIRSVLAKQRRKEAEERLRNDTMERLENGARRVEEAREQTKERARRGISRVEEVRLKNELRQQAKVLMLDRKMSEVEHNQEQKREELQRLAQERNEAMLAAAERRKSLRQERMERQMQREQQRRENLRRLEEQKKLEKDMKEQRAEEWEKKVQQHQKEASAEAEARSRKTEERIQQSAQIRQEKMTMLRQKLGRQEEKIKEVRQRKEREHDTKPTIKELMPAASEQEEEQLALKFSKVTATITRQGKSFVEKYQHDNSANLKELSRSKLKPLFSRLGSDSSPATVAQVRQSLRDILGAGSLEDIDHEYMRYFNVFERVVCVIMESRKTNNMPILRLGHEVLLHILTDRNEGKRHILSFVRAGNLVPLLSCISEEINALKHQPCTVPLAYALETVQLCVEVITSSSLLDSSLVSLRNQLHEDLSSTKIEKYCIAVARVCMDEEDLGVVHSATRFLYSQINIMSRRKSGCPTSWFKEMASACFALLQNILTPNGFPLNETSPLLSTRRVTIVFAVFNVLNSLARWNLETLQELLHDSPTDIRGGSQGNLTVMPNEVSNKFTRTELFHMLNGFFTYLSAHTDCLETIKEEKPLKERSGSVSFEEALKFGVTVEQAPLLAKLEVTGPTTSGVTSAEGLQPNNLRGALHECLLLIGYLSIQDPQIQGIFAWGKGKSLLSKILSAMPFQYFGSARHILYPTLLTILVDSEDNMTLAKEEMDITSLSEFIKEEYQGLSNKTKQQAIQRYKELQLEAAAKEGTAANASAANRQQVSWVDLLGGDDDFFIQSKQVKVKPQEPKVGATRHPLWTLEKERLSRMLKGQVITPSGYFKIEKRFPIALWPVVMEQLSNTIGSVQEAKSDS